jgi:hypothetical protein
VSKLWAWLHTDGPSWLAHGVLGLVLGLVFGPVVVAAAFVYRELSDAVGWLFRSGATRRPLRAMLKDGFMDLWAPAFGAVLAEFLKAQPW